MLSANVLYAQSSNPSLKFSNIQIQLGNINEDSLPKSGNFVFSNVGTSEFKINKAEVNSAVIEAKFSNNVIQPKGKGFVSIMIKKGMRVGKFAETVKVYSGKGNMYCNLLSISGNIVQKSKKSTDIFEYKSGNLSFLKKIHDLKSIKNTQTKIDSIMVYNKGKEAITFSFENLPSYLLGSAYPNPLPPGKTGGIAVMYDAVKKSDFGPVSDSLWIQTNDAVEPLKLILLKANIVEDFSKAKVTKVKTIPRMSMGPSSYYFGSVEKGQTYECDFTFSNSGTKELILRKVYCENPWFSVIFPAKTKINKNGAIHVTLKVPLLAKGKFSEKMLVISNDPNNSVVELSLTGEVK